MALLDHFRPPLSDLRHWESFHSVWANCIAEALNKDLLPREYFAEVEVTLGSGIEVDVAAFESGAKTRRAATPSATAVLPRTWAPRAPTAVLPAIFPDSIEVRVFQSEAGPRLVGALELVSPGNKDRPEARRAFAAKCSSYLQRGVGLVVVDVVTSRSANLHAELVNLLSGQAQPSGPHSVLYATAYHSVRKEAREEVEVWHETLTIGGKLPEMPLFLDKGLSLPIDLQGTYAEACARSRLG